MKKKPTTKTCTIPGCGRQHTTGGTALLCPMHYHRARRESPDALTPGKVKGAAASTRRHVYLPAAIDQQLTAYATETGSSVAATITEALLDFFSRAELRSALQHSRKGKT